MYLIVLGVFVLILVLVGIIVYQASAGGSVKTENLRLKDVIKAQNLSQNRFAAVVDKFTKEKHQFYEKAKTARSPNDYINIYNELLEIEPDDATIPGTRGS